MAFVLARYKFCAKMLEGKEYVVEIGCGDGFGIPMTAQAVKHLHCIDWDKRNTDGCRRRLKHLKNVTYENIDFCKTPLSRRADALFSVDMIEHLDPNTEEAFMNNVCKSLTPDGVLITGTPNITANQYATDRSRSQHINLKSHATLKKLCDRHFRNTFLFGMNDELLHTGFGPMCHYIWALSVGLK